MKRPRHGYRCRGIGPNSSRGCGLQTGSASRIAIRFVFALVVVASCGRAAWSSSGGPEAQVMGQAAIDPRLGERVPLDLLFLDAAGQTVTLRQVMQNRVVILHLVYYQCPMLCRLSSDGLLDGLDRLDLDVGSDFDVITLSFDPREGPELSSRARRLALARYARSTAEDGWHFLTGEAESIRRLTDAVGFQAVWDDATGQYAHPAGIFVLTPDGMISRYVSGIEFRPRDLRLAVVEASEGRLGSVSDQLLMLCYEYDPTTGKYGFAIMTAMRASGLFTVALLASAIVVMVRRERRKRAVIRP